MASCVLFSDGVIVPSANWAASFSRLFSFRSNCALCRFCWSRSSFRATSISRSSSVMFARRSRSSWPSTSPIPPYSSSSSPSESESSDRTCRGARQREFLLLVDSFVLHSSIQPFIHLRVSSRIHAYLLGLFVPITRHDLYSKRKKKEKEISQLDHDAAPGGTDERPAGITREPLDLAADTHDADSRVGRQHGEEVVRVDVPLYP